MRECPICALPIPLDVFACRTHWFKLPRDLRRAITRTWAMRRGDPGNEERIAEHEAAKATAEQWLREHAA